jgi:copper resistance protein D
VEIPDALSLVFQAVSFVLLLSAAGTPIFMAVFGGLLSDSAATTTRLGWKFAIAALVFLCGHQLLDGARMAGDMTGVADSQMQMMALRSSGGATFGLQIAGLVLIVVAPARAASPRSSIGLAGTLLIVVAFTVTGHTSVIPNRWPAAALLTLHLLTVAFWLGALWPLYAAATRETPTRAAHLIDAFSRKAVWLVPIILLAGAGLTWLLLPDWSAFRRPYGQLLLTKLTLFTLLMALAAANKWTFGPACARGDTRGFKRAVVVEYTLICAVLAVTAAMTMFYSPEAP